MSKRLCISILCFIIGIIIFNKSLCVHLEEGIDSFPESYKPYLLELQNKYPGWKFSSLYIDLDWNYVIDKENQFGKNLVPKSYSDLWKNTNRGEYNIEVDLGWVDCSRKSLEYVMDPRNFLNSVRIFQFEGLSYDERTNNIIGIEKILYGTEFYNRIVEYVDYYGRKYIMNKKYSDLILDASKISRVSSYHLASRIKQEVGPFLSHASISGTIDGYRGLYNFYNIGATSSSENLGAVKNGLQYAKDGKGASQKIKDAYMIPWDTKEKAITGGAIFLGSSYINRGQNTLYLQKFHVTDSSNRELFWHQYMTNILAPYSESKSIYNGYVNTGILNNEMSFIIPVYNNMPLEPQENLNILDSDFIKDNTKVYADVNTTLNVRTGPSTSYEVLTSISRSMIMERIALGNQNGELWDKVILPNGITGYVFHNYLKKLEFTEVINRNLKVQGNIITGIDLNNNSVNYLLGQLKNKLNTNLTIQIYDNNGKKLINNELVGTGSRVVILNENSNIVEEYKIIIYGDVNGDGKINSIDLLVLQRHILEIDKLNDIFLIAGNIRKNGANPSSLDSFLIQRHILGLQFIEQ